MRDDLGHGLAWGLDLAFGGGDGRAPAPRGRSDPGPVLGGGGGRVALARLPARAGHALRAASRVAFTWLARSFAASEELPSQYFFTVTPGAHRRRGVALRAGGCPPSARVRVSYLFYNVDENRSLGFAEGLLGVEYALGD